MEVKSMKLSKRESSLLVIAMIWVAVYVYYIFFLSNVFEQYRFLKKEISVNQQQLMSLQKDKDNMYSIIKEIDEIKKQIEHLEIIIPSDKKEPEIITQLESISKSAGVKLKGIIFEINSQENNRNEEFHENNHVASQLGKDQSKPQETQNDTNKNDYTEIPIKLNIEGSYDNIISFLNDLEKFERLFIMKIITLNKKPGDTLDMQLYISAYAVKFDQKSSSESNSQNLLNQQPIINPPKSP
jgi:Tfp pilus assembly protein PilO